MIQTLLTAIFAGCQLLFCGAIGASEPKLENVSYKKSQEELILYINPRCPYCKKVTDYLANHPRKITIKNTDEGKNKEELRKIGGKTQVPCLVIDQKALYESDDIIQWLKDHR